MRENMTRPIQEVKKLTVDRNSSKIDINGEEENYLNVT